MPFGDSNIFFTALPLRIADWGLRVAGCGLGSADWGLGIADFLWGLIFELIRFEWGCFADTRFGYNLSFNPSHATNSNIHEPFTKGKRHLESAFFCICRNTLPLLH
jgi:hypothetical protein